jgi:hypothetical protein
MRWLPARPLPAGVLTAALAGVLMLVALAMKSATVAPDCGGGLADLGIALGDSDAALARVADGPPAARCEAYRKRAELLKSIASREMFCGSGLFLKANRPEGEDAEARAYVRLAAEVCGQGGAA